MGNSPSSVLTPITTPVNLIDKGLKPVTKPINKLIAPVTRQINKIPVIGPAITNPVTRPISNVPIVGPFIPLLPSDKKGSAAPTPTDKKISPIKKVDPDELKPQPINQEAIKQDEIIPEQQGQGVTSSDKKDQLIEGLDNTKLYLIMAIFAGIIILKN